MGYHSIAWLPICAGLTIAGLVLSYLVGRRRGRLAMMRGAAWSLLPIAVYLTGSVEMFWKIGSAIGTYVDGFVFSPVKWAGIAVAGLAALLFAATRGRDRRRAARRAGPRAAGPEGSRAAGASGAGGTTVPGAGSTRELDPAGLAGPASTSSSRATAGKSSKSRASRKPRASRTTAVDNDDMSDIDEILRKRGI